MYPCEDDNKYLVLLLIIPTLMILNYYLALSICSVLDIPFNLTLSIFSIGFGYELTLVIFGIEMILSHYFTVLFRK